MYGRGSLRLRGYDYSQNGAYFVTICTHESKCLFGHVVDGRMRLNQLGRMVENEGALKAIRGYILANPAKWRDDEFYRE